MVDNVTATMAELAFRQVVAGVRAGSENEVLAGNVLFEGVYRRPAYGRQETMTQLAVGAGLDPAKPLPLGTKYVVRDGPATGHGRLPAGTRAVLGSIDVGGKIPATMDRFTADDRFRRYYFGVEEGCPIPPPNGGSDELVVA